ncbi:phosphotransferase [Streptomyces sp. SAI-041]|uniref:phosphotransferase n=1 Tax=Streptomyces sp. SAI-041 TaxID=2940548 RepID=UPI0032AF4964
MHFLFCWQFRPVTPKPPNTPPKADSPDAHDPDRPGAGWRVLYAPLCTRLLGGSVLDMTTEDEADREALVGGMVNAGSVFRRGALVERPAPPNAHALHAHLFALKDHGFDAAPTPVGLTADGREELTFIPGDVALPPFPPWVLTTTALESVGLLLRRLHAASATITVDPDVKWPQDLADPEGGTMLCHNDVCPDNVVFRDGRAAALIDFDLAAPGRPLWDVAMAARYWVPMLDPVSAAALYPAALDAPARLRILAESYDLSAGERTVLPGVIEQATEVCRAFVTRRVADGDPVYLQALQDRGGWERWDRMQTWLADHRETFTAALLA